MPPPVGVWLSEPISVLPGFAKTLQMNLMADAVACLGEINPMLACHCLDIFMVICVFKACLQGVVVDAKQQISLF